MSPEPPLRLLLCATAFGWAPLATFLGVRLLAAAIGRRPWWFTLFAETVLHACLATQNQAAITRYRSSYAAR